MSDLVNDLRRHAYMLIEQRGAMKAGYGVSTSPEDQDDLERVLDAAADEIERLREKQGTEA